MCKQGTTKEVSLCIPNLCDKKTVQVDACIAPIIQALNDTKIETLFSCCGHGRELGYITLRDGRKLLILPVSSELNALTLSDIRETLLVSEKRTQRRNEEYKGDKK